MPGDQNARQCVVCPAYFTPLTNEATCEDGHEESGETSRRQRGMTKAHMSDDDSSEGHGCLYVPASCGSNVPVASTRADDSGGDGDVSGRDEGTRR